MKNIDITVDLESLALSTNAAILQIAAVAWDRDAVESPFLTDVTEYVGYVDIRSCVCDKFDFEPHTLQWWGNQDVETKASVLSKPAYPLKDVLVGLEQWIADVKSTYNAESVCLWAQGSDFDIANLRNAFSRYELDFPVDCHSFRDARTFILEVGRHALFTGYTPFKASDDTHVYDLIPQNYSFDGQKHDALYDAKRTSYNVWYLFRKLRTLNIENK